MREYVATVVALGTVPSPFGRFTATRINERLDGVSVIFAGDDGGEMQLSFTRPRRCADCARGRSFAIGWPPEQPEGAALARAIVDRATSLDLESARAHFPPTVTGLLASASVSLLIRLDAMGVRLREILWQVGSTIAAASGRSTDIWQRIWDNLDARGPSIHDAASPFMLMLLWVLAALLLALETTHAMRRLDGRMRFAIAGLVTGSALVRRLLATDGPGDLHLNLLIEDYGLAPAGLLGLLGPFAPASPTSAITVATVLGSLAPGYCSLWSYAWRRERATAIAAGVLLSIQPLLIRFAGDCERQSYVLFLAVVALWGLTEFCEFRRWTGLAVTVVATLLCLNARPEALFLLVFLLLVVWPGHRLSRASLAAAGAVAATVVMAPLVSSRMRDVLAHASGIFAVPGSALPGPGTTIWMSWEYTSLVVMALFVAGVVSAIAKRERDGLWALVSIAVTTVVARGSVADAWIANARYQTLSLLPFAFLAAVGLTRIARITARRWNAKAARLATAGTWAAIVLSSLPPLYQVNLPRTIDYEFRFLASVLPTLPPDAVIYCARDDEADVGMKKYQLVSNMLGLGSQRWLVWNGEPLFGERATYFFVQPYCRVRPNEWQMRRVKDISARPADAAPGAFNACREAARCGGANVVAERVVPARRFSIDRFAESEVQIAMLAVSADSCGTSARSSEPKELH